MQIRGREGGRSKSALVATAFAAAVDDDAH
jgi:hypothetical protein